MDKIERIEKKLYMYALYDKELQKFDMVLSGFNDDDAAKYYINEFNNIKKLIDINFKDDVKEKKLSSFLERIHNTIIYCIGVFDFYTGEFTNVKNVLVDLFDFKFNESEVSNNVK